VNFDEAFRSFQELLARLDDQALGEAEREALEREAEEMREWFREQAVEEARPLVELEAELASLESRLSAADRDRVKRTKTRFMGAERTIGGGIPPKEINAMLDQANRVEELEARARKLRRAIALRKPDGKAQREALEAAESALANLGKARFGPAIKAAYKAERSDQLGVFEDLPAAVQAAAEEMHATGRVSDSLPRLRAAVGEGPLIGLVEDLPR
jgi:DNA repair exonuclease SbcCD ATPase subunit